MSRGPQFSAELPRDWRSRARCLQHDPELFFPNAADWESVEAARRVCRGCPVWFACLSYAMVAEGATYYRSGVYGGLGEHQRALLARELLTETTGDR